ASTSVRAQSTSPTNTPFYSWLWSAGGDYGRVGEGLNEVETCASGVVCSFVAANAMTEELTISQVRLEDGATLPGNFSFRCVLQDYCADGNDPKGYSLPVRIMVTPETVPCSTDMNGSGDLGVQDIFDFLAFYFAMDPRGDFNGAGGHTVQDIFDFL